jgi:hypothetical protein
MDFSRILLFGLVFVVCGVRFWTLWFVDGFDYGKARGFATP